MVQIPPVLSQTQEKTPTQKTALFSQTENQLAFGRGAGVCTVFVAKNNETTHSPHTQKTHKAWKKYSGDFYDHAPHNKKIEGSTSSRFFLPL
jgi:cytoplasmic iron level regulating protein YaaA (DUF328/UPF0246 family)